MTHGRPARELLPWALLFLLVFVPLLRADAVVVPKVLAANVLLFVLLVPATVLLRLLGYMLVGSLVGVPPFVVRVGAGRCRRHWRVGSMVVLWYGLIPTAGYVQWAPRGHRWVRLRTWLTTLGGTASTLGLVVLGVALSRWPLERAALGTELGPVHLACVLNVYMLVSSLIPSQGPERATDGLNLLRIPRLSAEKVEAARAGYVYYRVHAALARGDFEAARALSQHGVEAFPDSELLLFTRATFESFAGEHDAATEHLGELLGRLSEESRLRPAVLFLLALELAAGPEARDPSPEELDQATRLCAAAREREPENPDGDAVEGIVQLQRGDLEQGLDRLSKSFQAMVSELDRATVSAWLAIGCSRAGHMREAHRHLTVARELWPHGGDVRRAQQALDQAQD